MKKIRLFIITLFFCVTTVEAKTYSSYNIGDLVTFSKGSDTNSTWYVIENSDSRSDYLKILKYTDAKNLTAVRFDPGGSNVYETSTLKSLVDAYGDNLNLEDDLLYIGLINLQELQTLGCTKVETVIDCSNAPSWLYKGGHWTSIPVENTSDQVYTFSRGVTTLNIIYSIYNIQTAVRPVIIVKKESILGNISSNEERNFNDFSISCNKELTGTEEFECYIKMDKDIQNMNFDLSIEGLSLIENFSIENITWNESFQTGVDNNGIYEIKNNTLTKIASSKDSDNLLKITGKVKDLKEDGKLTIKLTNLSISDELGDYQNINEVTKEIKILKTEKRQDLIENPNTGIQNITIVLLIILAILSLSITISIIIKHNKKKIQNK